MRAARPEHRSEPRQAQRSQQQPEVAQRNVLEVTEHEQVLSARHLRKLGLRRTVVDQCWQKKSPAIRVEERAALRLRDKVEVLRRRPVGA